LTILHLLQRFFIDADTFISLNSFFYPQRIYYIFIVHY